MPRGTTCAYGTSGWAFLGLISPQACTLNLGSALGLNLCLGLCPTLDPSCPGLCVPIFWISSGLNLAPMGLAMGWACTLNQSLLWACALDLGSLPGAWSCAAIFENECENSPWLAPAPWIGPGLELSAGLTSESWPRAYALHLIYASGLTYALRTCMGFACDRNLASGHACTGIMCRLATYLDLPRLCPAP
ncbi:hypothetical protein FNV43_RR19489 [Rhamnella rubrinervis]|uniref:Uncharacterized protein n=1 Tax=Rhamnella rubrinervis TaxID=2594499 RepID=A0A8K0DZQ1_9ROSA|nr:hypothetical protein FNV43_RR19489 [Rhamnella rubrinervis]